MFKFAEMSCYLRLSELESALYRPTFLVRGVLSVDRVITLYKSVFDNEGEVTLDNFSQALMKEVSVEEQVKEEKLKEDLKE